MATIEDKAIAYTLILEAEVQLHAAAIVLMEAGKRETASACIECARNLIAVQEFLRERLDFFETGYRQ